MSESTLPFTDRLQLFFSKYQSLQPRNAEDRFSSALKAYLDRAAPLLRVEDTLQTRSKPVRVLEPHRLGQVLALLSDPLRLAERQGHFTDMWSIAGLGRNEVRNAQVLAWLLNPRGSHGLGPSVLRAVFHRVSRKKSDWLIDDSELAHVMVRTEHQPLDDIHERVDIALDGPSFIAFIEVKIGAREGSTQLSRYLQAAEQKRRAYGKRSSYVVYLSPRPSRSQNSSVAEIAWSDINAALRSVSRTLEKHSFVRLMLRSYLDHISNFE